MSSNTRRTPTTTTTTTTMSSNITTNRTATLSSSTRRTTVPCVHDDANVLPPPNDGRLIVRSKYQHFRRMVYHHRETGRVIATIPYRPTSAPTVSNPFNPLCDRCTHNFLLYLTLLGGYSLSDADQVLQGLQLRVMDILDRIQMDGRDDHDFIVLQDLLFCNIVKREELHTWDEEEYIGWITQLGRQERARAAAAAEVEVRATPAADAEEAVEELERVEVDAVEEGLVCSICLDELSSGGGGGGGGDGGGGAAKEAAEEVVVVKVPCGHLFHKGCIVEWFGRSHFCPLCRFEMPRAVVER